jgi:hypothetical protein
MKALFTFALWFVSVFVTVAQKSPIKFGEIPLEDLKMKIYVQDSSANAVVLADYGEAYLAVSNLSVSLIFERHVRIKILSKEGLEWANAAIPLYLSGSNEERLSNLKAATYNLEDGKVVESKLDKSGIFKEKFNRNINHTKFTLPNVKEGSVIEYSYKINSEFITQFPNWQFQRSIPTRHSEFWASIPDFFIFEKYMQGYLATNTYEVVAKNNVDYAVKAHHWIMKNAPAFKEEPYMTCEDDFVSRINFAISHFNFPGQPVKEIMGSWQKLNNDLVESANFGGAIRGSSFLKKTVEEITAGKTEPLDKITAIHNYVRQTIEWNGEKDKYADNLKKVFELKKGTAADINTLLAAMLDKAGMVAEMVLLSTRDHGFIRIMYPMEEQFNYAVCLVRLPDGKSLFLDATDKFLPPNVLPSYCLNGEGMVVSKTNHGWIKLETKTKAKTIVNSEFVFAENGTLTGKLTFHRDGYDANAARKEYISKGEETYLKDFVGSKSWELGKSVFENVETIDQLLKETHELVLTDHASQSGDVIYLNPFVVSQYNSNPFKAKDRKYPIDFGSLQENLYMFKLVLPDGYVFDEIPKSKMFMLPENAARYTFNVTQNGNIINITSNLQINRNIFYQEEYLHLREFYNQVLAKQAEQIVIKKKL